MASRYVPHDPPELAEAKERKAQLQKEVDELMAKQRENERRIYHICQQIFNILVEFEKYSKIEPSTVRYSKTAIFKNFSLCPGYNELQRQQQHYIAVTEQAQESKAKSDEDLAGAKEVPF